MQSHVPSDLSHPLEESLSSVFRSPSVLSMTKSRERKKEKEKNEREKGMAFSLALSRRPLLDYTLTFVSVQLTRSSESEKPVNERKKQGDSHKESEKETQQLKKVLCRSMARA